MKGKKIFIGVFVLAILIGLNSWISNSDFYAKHVENVAKKDSLENEEKLKLMMERMIPQNQGQDGRVNQVVNYLQKTLHNPDSYEPLLWSDVEKTAEGLYIVEHEYRAKNRFNALVIERKTFTLDRGGSVIRVE